VVLFVEQHDVELLAELLRRVRQPEQLGALLAAVSSRHLGMSGESQYSTNSIAMPPKRIPKSTFSRWPFFR